MEELSIQKRGALAAEKVLVNYELDKMYKLGIFNQCIAFINKFEEQQLLSLEDQISRMRIYNKMANY
ncbi:MAG: hypothetical protein DHS20C18_24470 [Saprospiraceae bacterium]|nr:MAG: hypothetical protein DHS20C18_24470 [Saprospiraceae bacterium]